MQKRRKIWVGIILLVVILIGVASIFGNKKPDGTEVEFGKVEKRTIVETVSASGKIFPEVEVKISSDVSGEIVELYVQEGDSVVAGQLLAKIDPDVYLSAVDRGVASVNSAKSQMAIAKAQVETNKAQAEQIKAQLENAKSIHNRNIKLLKDGVISQLEFDQSLSNQKSLEANLRSAEASIRSAEKNIEASGFAVKSSEANLKELSTNLRRTTITAPVAGIVSSLFVEKGERVVGTIQMTGTELMRISNLQKMEVQVDVSENDIPKVRLGNQVEIKVDAYTNKKFRGKVTRIANSASNIASGAQSSVTTNQVTNFTIKIMIEPESYIDLVKSGIKYPFRPGMTAAVDIFTSKVENVMAVPIQAVTIREKDGIEKNRKLTEEDFEEVVFVVSKDTLIKKSITTGIQDDSYIEVKTGLAESEKIVIGPYAEVSSNLKQGSKVVEKKDEEKEETEKK